MKMVQRIIRLPLDFVVLTFHWTKGCVWLLGFTLKEMFDLPKEKNWPFQCLTERNANGLSSCIPSRKYANPDLFKRVCPDFANTAEEGCYCTRSMEAVQYRWRPSTLRIFISGMALFLGWTIVFSFLFIALQTYQPARPFMNRLQYQGRGYLTNLRNVMLPSSRIEISNDTKQKKRRNFLDNAEALFNEGRIKEALLDFKNAIKHDHNNAQCYSRYGDCLFALEYYRESLESYKSAIKIDSGNWQTYLKIAQLYLRFSDFDSALEHAEDVLKLSAKVPEALLIIARCHEKSGNMDLSISYIKELINVGTTNTKTYIDAGFLSSKLNQSNYATSCFNSALNLEPSNCSARIGLAKLKQIEKDFEAAHFYLQSALDLEPTNLNVHSAMAELEVDQGFIDKAIKSYRDISNMEQCTAGHRLRLAQLLMSQNKIDDAHQELKDIVRDYPQNVGAHRALATIYLRNGLYTSAIDHLNHAIQYDRTDPENLKLIATAYTGQSSYQEAILAIDKYLSIVADDIHGELLRVRCYQGLNNPEKAMHYCNLAIRKFPKSPLPWITMGQIATKNGDPEDAIKSYRNAVKLSPNDPVALRNLTLMLIEQGDNSDEALSVAESLFNRFPSNPDIVNTYGLALFSSREFKRAKNTFLLSQSLNHRKPTTNLLLGKTLIELGEIPEAKDALKKSLAASRIFRGKQEAEFLLSKLEQSQ